MLKVNKMYGAFRRREEREAGRVKGGGRARRGQGGSVRQVIVSDWQVINSVSWSRCAIC